MFNIRSLFAAAARVIAGAAQNPVAAAATFDTIANAGKPYRVPCPRPSRSKYMPHQGKRERVRRAMGGFAGNSPELRELVKKLRTTH